MHRRLRHGRSWLRLSTTWPAASPWRPTHRRPRPAEVVTWPDNSIGCPLRDRQYFDDPVEGTRVHLVARGELYRYHTGGDRTQPFLCDISLKSEVPIRRIEP
jgi:hypothetical protein